MKKRNQPDAGVSWNAIGRHDALGTHWRVRNATWTIWSSDWMHHIRRYGPIGGMNLVAVLLSGGLLLVSLLVLRNSNFAAWPAPLWFAIMFAVAAWQFRRLGNRLVVQRRKAEARCLSCGYDLKGIEAHVTQLVRCPECGLTWQLPPPVVPTEH